MRSLALVILGLALANAAAVPKQENKRLLGILTGVTGGLTSSVSSLGSSLGNTVNNLVNNVGDVLEAVVDIVADVVQSLADALSNRVNVFGTMEAVALELVTSVSLEELPGSVRAVVSQVVGLDVALFVSIVATNIMDANVPFFMRGVVTLLDVRSLGMVLASLTAKLNANVVVNLAVNLAAVAGFDINMVLGALVQNTALVNIVSVVSAINQRLPNVDAVALVNMQLQRTLSVISVNSSLCA